MKNILKISECAFIENEEEKSESLRFNSCRFCLRGRGTNRVTDTETNEVFYICDSHLEKYDSENDCLIVEEESEENES